MAVYPRHPANTATRDVLGVSYSERARTREDLAEFVARDTGITSDNYEEDSVSPIH